LSEDPIFFFFFHWRVNFSACRGHPNTTTEKAFPNKLHRGTPPSLTGTPKTFSRQELQQRRNRSPRQNANPLATTRLTRASKHDCHPILHKLCAQLRRLQASALAKANWGPAALYSAARCCLHGPMAIA